MMCKDLLLHGILLNFDVVKSSLQATHLQSCQYSAPIIISFGHQEGKASIRSSKSQG